MHLESLGTCKKVSVSQESLEACRAVSVILGSLEAWKRVSVILVSLFQVSHYARFARALVVTTLRHSCGPNLGKRCNQSGTNVEQQLDQIGTKLGLGWDQSGPCVGPLWRADVSILLEEYTKHRNL